VSNQTLYSVKSDTSFPMKKSLLHNWHPHYPTSKACGLTAVVHAGDPLRAYKSGAGALPPSPPPEEG